MTKPLVAISSGTPVEPLYTSDSLGGFDPATDLGAPGEFPYTRGIHPNMYRVPPIKFAPSRNLPCGHRIRGRSSSWELRTTAFRGRCHDQGLRRLRRRSTRKSDTSKFSYSSRSQLKGPSNRMQRLYRGPSQELNEPRETPSAL